MSVISLTALASKHAPNSPRVERAKFNTDGEISVGIWSRDDSITGTIEVARKFKFNVRFRPYSSFNTPYFTNGYAPELWDELCEKVSKPVYKHYRSKGVGQGIQTLAFSGLHAKDDKFCDRKFEQNSFCWLAWDLDAAEPVATHAGLLLPFGDYVIPLTPGKAGQPTFKGRGSFDFVAYETYFHFPPAYRDNAPVVTEDNDAQFKAYLRAAIGVDE